MLYIKLVKVSSWTKAYVNYLRTKKVNEGGRARKFGKAQKKAFLAKANVESVLNRIYGQQGALKQQQAMRLQKFQGRAREDGTTSTAATTSNDATNQQAWRSIVVSYRVD